MLYFAIERKNNNIVTLLEKRNEIGNHMYYILRILSCVSFLCCSSENFSPENKNFAYYYWYIKSTITFNGFYKDGNCQEELHGYFWNRWFIVILLALTIESIKNLIFGIKIAAIISRGRCINIFFNYIYISLNIF